MAFNIKKMTIPLYGILVFATLAACSPEVGSKEWCADLKDKPKGEWSANEAADFAKSCVF
ncbi:MAG: DUF3012 domain-containing protein [Rhodospirillales bacterium]|jgi:hypothetical protein|nr:DUF3012 domain-containing protein [Rhodospirillales bacterium]MBT4040800.1 DUF3012 domain-containing protein [Rhodospirillales bacterium]MBT4627713.1 DUF3012 domain-containing protein [Rhodospirillales bacterium]MBT5352040.1 DUF3012 domain-containing protein [Rhodospirillales bacterium]MBT5521809.1 DUF3012 domain-containing protein [Rhodospirillales bacterium]